MEKLYPYQQQIIDRVRPGSGQDITCRLPRQSGATEVVARLALDPRFERVAVAFLGKFGGQLLRDRIGWLAGCSPLSLPQGIYLFDIKLVAQGVQNVEGITVDLVIIDDGFDTPLRSHVRRYMDGMAAPTNAPTVQIGTYDLDEVVVSLEDVYREREDAGNSIYRKLVEAELARRGIPGTRRAVAGRDTGPT